MQFVRNYIWLSTLVILLALSKLILAWTLNSMVIQNCFRGTYLVIYLLICGNAFVWDQNALRTFISISITLFSIAFTYIRWDLQAVEESLKSVNLYNGGVADKQAGKYSGGMKRRLSVAISLIGDPKVSPCTNSSSWEDIWWYVLVCLPWQLFHDTFARLSIWMSLALDWIQLRETTCGMLSNVQSKIEQ